MELDVARRPGIYVEIFPHVTNQNVQGTMFMTYTPVHTGVMVVVSVPIYQMTTFRNLL